MSEIDNFPSGFRGLLDIMSRLVAVLEREIELLRGSATPELEALQRDKTELAETYRSRVAALRESEEMPEPALRAELVQAVARVEEALERNKRALAAAKATGDRVLQAVVREVEAQRSRQAGYSASGQCAPGGESGGSSEAVSVAIDQRF